MRTKNLFRTLAAATLAVVSMSAFAQVTTTGPVTAVKNGPGPLPNVAPAIGILETEVVDFVTVGSITPYSVTPDANVAAMVASDGATFHPSVFNWRLTFAGTGTGTLGQLVTGAALTTNASTPVYPGYFDQNDIQIAWGANADVATLRVSEKSRNTLGITACDGGDSLLTIYVMPKPSVEWAEASVVGLSNDVAGDRIVGGCGVATPGAPVSYNIPINLESYTSDMKIAYTVDKYTMANLTVAATTFTQILAPGAILPQVSSANYNEGTDTWLTATPGTPNSGVVTLCALNVPDPSVDAASFQAAYGKWVYTVTAVDDRTSRKTGIASANTELPGGIAAQTFTVYSFPKPITGTIKHVANVGW